MANRFPRVSPRRLLLAVYLVLCLVVDICCAAAATTTTSSAKTTKPSTTSTKTTKSSKTPKPTTTKAKQYTWLPVSSKPNCPTYYPTASLATQTFSSNGAVGTAFVNLYGGMAPLQFAARAENSSNAYLYKVANASQIMYFNPGKYLAIIDNFGVSLWDSQCAEGVKLRIPNLFNLTGPQSTTTTSVSKRSDLVHRSVSPLEAHLQSSGLVARGPPGTTTFSVYFRFVDDCGRDKAVNLLTTSHVFECSCLSGLIGSNSTVQDLGGGRFVAWITSPSIDLTRCYHDMDDLAKMVTDGPSKYFDGLVGAGGFVKWLGGDLIAGTAAGAFLKRIGVALAAPEVVGALAIYGGITGFFNLGGNALLKKGICGSQGFRYHLDTYVDYYGSVRIDSQDAPFKSVSDKVITIPGGKCKDSCINYNNDANNCGSCGNRCAAGKICISGVCRIPGWCSNPVDCSVDPYLNACGDQKGFYCFDIDGSLTNGICAPNYTCIDRLWCHTSADCWDNYYCSILNCCGTGICMTNSTN